jgi:regulation of enolase protein 1 (concanavalin A-like superfamily)
MKSFDFFARRLLFGSLVISMALGIGRGITAADDAKSESLAPAASQATAEAGHDLHPVALLRDDFKDKFALNWNIVREDKEHISLTKDPGHLTITTQRGTIHGDVEHDDFSQGIRAKNIFLLPNVLSESSDFSITLAVRNFEPTTFWHQVGLLCYDDDANYVKWSFEYSQSKPGSTNFVMVRQTDKVPEHDLIVELPNPKRLWLRVTRRETDYECAYSTDGREFKVAGSRGWGKHPPKFVGFLAKNGGNPDAGEIDVSIDSFELLSPPSASPTTREGESARSNP